MDLKSKLSPELQQHGAAVTLVNSLTPNVQLMESLPHEAAHVLSQRAAALSAAAADPNLSRTGKAQKAADIQTDAAAKIADLQSLHAGYKDSLTSALDAAQAAPAPADSNAAILQELQTQRILARVLRQIPNASDASGFLNEVTNVAKAAAQSGDALTLRVLREELPTLAGKSPGLYDASLQAVTDAETPLLPPQAQAARQLAPVLTQGTHRVEIALSQAAYKAASDPNGPADYPIPLPTFDGDSIQA